MEPTGEVKEDGGKGPKVSRVERVHESLIVDEVACRASGEPLRYVRKTMIAVQDPCEVIAIRRIGTVKGQAV